MLRTEEYRRRRKARGGIDCMDLNAQELATVLAGLRLFQQIHRPRQGAYAEAQVIKLADIFFDVKPLTFSQIDSLCERLNTEGLND